MQSTLLLFFFLFYIAIPSSVLADEISALLSFKSDLIDPLDAIRWARISPHCNWTGVGCNPMGSVESLDLARMNLSGLINLEVLRQLPNLTRLTLRSNAFTSPLPPSPWNLTALRDLDISDNGFVGHFPISLDDLPSLKLLNASGNNFVGALPEGIRNSASLEILDLRGGFFTGSIPRSYMNLQRLKFLGLSGNNLTGKIPVELGRLANLESLIIGYNGLEGNIPAEFGNLTNLRYLDMAIGNLDGLIPAELGRLKHLTTVYLYKNNLQGRIPEEIGNISTLVSLDLSDNHISGEIPASLAQLGNLQLLNLMCNQIKGSVPTRIAKLPKLEVLEIWNNSLTGALPVDLGRNSQLQQLDVSSNSLTGDIPSGLCDGGNLTKLILFNNAFTGPIPIGISTCRSLVRVRIHNNQLNGTIPIGLGQLPRLQRLELATNNLEGEIPDDISLSTSLSFIDLSHNHLQLSLPSNILAIPMLQTFIASDNELTGEIPEQDCSSLTVLDLSNNRLSGSIPSCLASCERLVSINLRSNGFTGEIPTSFSTMPALSILDLSNNRLSGAIPSSFGSSPTLETLDLSYNQLSGPVPGTGLLNPDELAGNPSLCGGVLTPCDSNSSSSSLGIHFKHVASGWAIGISAVLAFGISIVGAARLYERSYGRLDEESKAWPWRMTAFQRLSFTSADVLASVKESNVVGMGAAGIVYKAEVLRGESVAVKKLWRKSESGDFAAEVGILGRLRHRNIVRMLGYLRNDVDAMIVYEFVPNGSLWEALHGPPAARVLVDWVSRYNVAAGIAQGLAYLHHDCHPPVIHRDVKSNNILLDGKFEARIADFGLARIVVRKDETLSTVAGSYGYIAPEYGYTLKVDQKSDTYSFGVVVMELVTGKKAIEPEFGECQDIVGWVRERLRLGGDGVLDASIGGACNHVREEMMLVLRVAVLCTARSPKDRPSMRDVITMLGEAKPRRKSSVAKDRPVFTTSPDSGYV